MLVDIWKIVTVGVVLDIGKIGTLEVLVLFRRMREWPLLYNWKKLLLTVLYIEPW